MKFTTEIAKRYLLGKKSTNAINIISWVSIIGMTIGTAALILILSVFNGFETLISGMYSAFNPDLKVLPVKGKFFELKDDQMKRIIDLDGIKVASKTVDQVSLFEYKDVQKPGVIKGVDENFVKVTSIDSSLRNGDYKVLKNNTNYGIFGRGLGSNLTINYKDQLTPVKVHTPTRVNQGGILSKVGKEFNTIYVYPSGNFAVGGDPDVLYAITNFESVNNLLDQDDLLSSIELKMTNGANEKEVRQQILSILGDNFMIKNRYQQEETFLKVMNIEKSIAFLIVVLTLGIIAFNMVGSIWMMVLEKKKDISILRSMGYETKDIRRIFMAEGMIITFLGIVIGIVLALILYVLQKEFGIVSIPNGFMISAYPIELKFSDFIIVIFTVLGVGFVASLIPSYRAGMVSAFVRQEM